MTLTTMWIFPRYEARFSAGDLSNRQCHASTGTGVCLVSCLLDSAASHLCQVRWHLLVTVQAPQHAWVLAYTSIIVVGKA